MPIGFIARFEPHHWKYFDSYSPVKYLLVKIDDADRILSNGYTAGTYFNSKLSIITTSTIEDTKLEKLDWTRERDIVQQFEPDFHIPTDYPAYMKMDEQIRIEHIRRCMAGTKWMADQLSTSKTKILPLIKGVTRIERNICYQTYKELSINYCVFYGSQYFGGGIGNQFHLLENEIQCITSEQPTSGILLIGLLVPRRLKRLPPQVVAAAGNRWIRDCTNEYKSRKDFNKKLQALKCAVEGALGNGQMTIPAGG